MYYGYGDEEMSESDVEHFVLRNSRGATDYTDIEKHTYRNWNEIDTMEFPEDRWRVKNLVPKSGFVILAAISGEGKSWLALELTKCIQNGLDFLGTEHFSTEQCNVLYINAEMSESELQRRGRQLGYGDHDNSPLFFNHDGFNFYDEDKQDVDYLYTLAKQKDIKVIVVDTFRAVAGGLKEDKAEEVRKLFKYFSIFKAEGISIIFLDHFRKPSRFEKKIPQKEHLFASQDKAASVDVLLMISTDLETETTHVYQRKNRLGREIEPFTYTMKDVEDEGVLHTRFEYEGVIESEQAVQEHSKEIILAALGLQGQTRKELIEIVYDEAQIGERSVSEAIRSLQKEGSIEMSKKGRENFYTLPKTEENEQNNELF